MQKREFTVANEAQFNRAGPIRWLISHVLRYPLFVLSSTTADILANVLYAATPVLVGRAFDVLTRPDRSVAMILGIALTILAARAAQGLASLGNSWSNELLAQRVERDAREELYTSLLGKSQTFHGRQRIGDVMARATNDVRQLNMMINPGLALIFDSSLSVVVPIVAIALMRIDLLLAPLLFLIGFFFTLRRYTQQLNPVAGQEREQFGVMNAGLEEALSGIEVVKATAQEQQEWNKFSDNARLYRNLFVREGEIQARYLPLLVYSAMFAGGLAQALLLFWRGDLTIGQVIAFMGLLGILRFPTFISLWSFYLVQLGLAGAERILSLIRAETELDQNPSGISRPMQGDVRFENASFGHGDQPILKHISFHIRPGQTVAIVGQTGSGKSTLTQLINRIYDVTEGRILIDGIDVRDWNLDSLRSQISTIEQDVFLFSRSIGDNIAFGAGGRAGPEDIHRAAREAQAHDFIMGFPEDYRTMVGERGVTLSGGQRQRIAIARAFLTAPRILILDDSTSAVDSATEDEIQQAMRRILRGRTTFLITHRLSQIRWADHILVLRRGELVDQGTHEQLMQSSDAYQRIFSHYDSDSSSAIGYELTADGSDGQHESQAAPAWDRRNDG